MDSVEFRGFSTISNSKSEQDAINHCLLSLENDIKYNMQGKKIADTQELIDDLQNKLKKDLFQQEIAKWLVSQFKL